MLPSLAAKIDVQPPAGLSLSDKQGGIMGEIENHLNLSSG